MKAIITILATAMLFASCSNGTTTNTSKVDSTKVMVDTTKKTVDTTAKAHVDTISKKK